AGARGAAGLGMKVFLVRHASAGKRTEWRGDDRLRPLDERGVRQAELLVEQLAEALFERIVSSPFLRCVQTVEPLAAARGMTVETDEALSEGAGAEAALDLFRRLETDLVACVHGDLCVELLGRKARKGSTAVLELGPAGDIQVLEQLEPAA
ncbi:MAG: histidine phosphatase family protein, partial [Gaiellaceae bacterium]